jgi:hypothetical protein
MRGDNLRVSESQKKKKKKRKRKKEYINWGLIDTDHHRNRATQYS